MFSKPAFREGIMHIIQIFEWYSRFRSGKTSVENAKQDIAFGIMKSGIHPTGPRDVLQHLLEDGDFVILNNGSLDIGSSRIYSSYFAFLCSSF